MLNSVRLLIVFLMLSVFAGCGEGEDTHVYAFGSDPTLAVVLTESPDIKYTVSDELRGSILQSLSSPGDRLEEVLRAFPLAHIYVNGDVFEFHGHIHSKINGAVYVWRGDERLFQLFQDIAGSRATGKSNIGGLVQVDALRREVSSDIQ